MSNFVEDTINFGFGLFAYSREKLEAMVEKMVDAGKVQKQDAQGFMHDLVQKGEEQRSELKTMIRDEVKEVVSDMKGSGLTKEDIRAIIKEELAAAKQD